MIFSPSSQPLAPPPPMPLPERANATVWEKRQRGDTIDLTVRSVDYTREEERRDSMPGCLPSRAH